MENNTFNKSWEILKDHKIIFLPNTILLLISIILISALVFFSGIWDVLVLGDYSILKEVILSKIFLTFFVVYLIITIFIDNFILAFKYGLIKGIISKGKTTIKDVLEGGNENAGQS